MTEIPRKPYYKPSEVCSLTDTQPYVLRFWESEFPQLASKKGVYRRKDIDLVLRIKQMLNERDCTIAEVRSALSEEGNGDLAPAPAASSTATEETTDSQPRSEKATRPKTFSTSPKKATRAKAVLPFAEKTAPVDTVPRSRYEDALDEVAHLRLELQESEALLRKAETGTRKAHEENERLRERCQAAVDQIEQLIARLS